ncbi:MULTISPECIES: hypothetical protein [unclassified Duganella]|uniref:hypothetical protein n=1 Tax=unclassified Duganella TaxID=2636909 RepID=UPI0018F3A6B4|nr:MULTISPECIES: hypothetical protein [unclassified Duganella]
MTTLSPTSRLLLGAAMAVALLGGCNKRPADQPPTPSVNTPEPAAPATTPPATTPPPAQQNNPPPPTTNQ